MAEDNIGYKKIDASIFDLNKSKILEIVDSLEIKEGSVVCFTGNRPASLPWKSNENCDLFLSFKSNIKFFLEELIKKGVTKFISGMAMGFDIVMAEIILELKADYPVEIEGALPCIGQEDKWTSGYKNRYRALLEKLDTTTLVSNFRYFEGCFHIRNHYMVNNADIVVAGSFKEGGGTASTVEYAKKHNKQIVIFKL